MPSSSPSRRAGFSLFPKRGSVAFVTTILAVMLLFAFKTDDRPGPGLNLSTPAFIGGPGQATPHPLAVNQPQQTRTAQQQGPQPRTTPRPIGSPAVGPAQPTPPPPGGSGTGTLTGQAIDTYYGVVQVAVVMNSGKIVDVQELQMPYDRRLSAQISAEAGPLLRNQVLQAQSANINGVSGASFTSYGFYVSLQSALSQVQ